MYQCQRFRLREMINTFLQSDAKFIPTSYLICLSHMHCQVQSECPGWGVKLGYTWAFAAVWEGEGGASNTNHCHMLQPKLLQCVLFQQQNCLFIFHSHCGG